MLNRAYAAVIEESENIPEEIATPPMSVRQRGNTITYCGRYDSKEKYIKS
ncbi:hypothetical protein SAMN05444422_101466 [Halobiforma haloterrestris]|uniref:Uncharacterized protein n=1 Tax=Natronobacterium haloterrestre TaxID=148448 RepID=A0A1I1DBB6_NATHA|nr:hypothetical protein SAMN05444422_101466 [Halobiforma haloterrestris]